MAYKRGVQSDTGRGSVKIAGNPSFDYTESAESRRRRKLKNLQGRPGTAGEGSAAGDALKKLPTGPKLPPV